MKQEDVCYGAAVARYDAFYAGVGNHGTARDYGLGWLAASAECAPARATHQTRRSLSALHPQARARKLPHMLRFLAKAPANAQTPDAIRAPPQHPSRTPQNTCRAKCPRRTHRHPAVEHLECVLRALNLPGKIAPGPRRACPPASLPR
eukprot:SAG11_NODE_11740_length_740_cov_3.789392_1_plen_148_part_00